MRYPARFLSTVVFAALAACSGCSGAPPAAPPGDTLARLRTLVADPACTDDSQCRTVPLGHTPCGGPEGYLPWSSVRAAADEVRALGERYRLERQAANSAAGRVGACRFSPDPGALCRAGTCQLGSPGFQVQ